MTAPTDPLWGNVAGPVHLNNLRAFPWAANLTVNMLTWGKERNEISRVRCGRGGVLPPLRDQRDPCVDLTDQFAVVEAVFAPAYFNWPYRELGTPNFKYDAVVKNYRCKVGIV